MLTLLHKTRITTAALKNILNHLKNQHENCGNWCKRKLKKTTQIFIIKGEKLYDDLAKLLSTYDANAFKICATASSNRNESWNDIVYHQLPKNKCYSKGVSANYRVASAVLIINEGISYVHEVKEILETDSNKKIINFRKKKDLIRFCRVKKAKTISCKRKDCIFQKKEKILKNN